MACSVTRNGTLVQVTSYEQGFGTEITTMNCLKFFRGRIMQNTCEKLILEAIDGIQEENMGQSIQEWTT